MSSKHGFWNKTCFIANKKMRFDKRTAFILGIINSFENHLTTMKKLLILTVCSMSVIAFVSCKKKGPAEKAGEKLDEAIEELLKIQRGQMFFEDSRTLAAYLLQGRKDYGRTEQMVLRKLANHRRCLGAFR